MAVQPNAQHTLARFCQPQEPQDNYVCDRDCLVNLREIEGVDARVEALKDKVVYILDQVRQRGQVEGFYIGKTYVPQRRRRDFDAMVPTSWRKDGIASRWGHHNNRGYNGLIVLTVVTREVLPRNPENENADDNQSHTDQQEYALMLEQKLLHNYKIENYDSRIANDNFGEGRPAARNYRGYAVYIAIRFAEEEGEGEEGEAQQNERQN